MSSLKLSAAQPQQLHVSCCCLIKRQPFLMACIGFAMGQFRSCTLTYMGDFRTLGVMMGIFKWVENNIWSALYTRTMWNQKWKGRVFCTFSGDFTFTKKWKCFKNLWVISRFLNFRYNVIMVIACEFLNRWLNVCDVCVSENYWKGKIKLKVSIHGHEFTLLELRGQSTVRSDRAEPEPTFVCSSRQSFVQARLFLLHHHALLSQALRTLQNADLRKLGIVSN